MACLACHRWQYMRAVNLILKSRMETWKCICLSNHIWVNLALSPSLLTLSLVTYWIHFISLCILLGCWGHSLHLSSGPKPNSPVWMARASTNKVWTCGLCVCMCVCLSCDLLWVKRGDVDVDVVKCIEKAVYCVNDSLLTQVFTISKLIYPLKYGCVHCSIVITFDEFFIIHLFSIYSANKSYLYPCLQLHHQMSCNLLFNFVKLSFLLSSLLFSFNLNFIQICIFNKIRPSRS